LTDEEIQTLLVEVGLDMQEARAERAVTQRQLAARMNTNQGQIHLLEHAHTNMTLATLFRFYDALDMDVVIMGMKRKRI
jgi:transcriptional regulator with XRE-family HTH domain